MNKIIIASLAIVAASFAQAQTVIFDNLVTSTGGSNFAGAGIASGPGATGGISRMLATKISPIAGGVNITSWSFAVANFNSIAHSVRARVRFWNADGAAGAPGTYYSPGGTPVGFSFNAFTFGTGVTTLTSTSTFVAPTTTFWAGIVFDNVGTTTGATNADLDNFGLGLFNQPAAVGVAGDQTFHTTAAGSFFAPNNPAGSMLNLVNANQAPIVGGWKFQTEAVPEPMSMVALGLGVAAIATRKRKQK